MTQDELREVLAEHRAETGRMLDEMDSRLASEVVDSEKRTSGAVMSQLLPPDIKQPQATATTRVESGLIEEASTGHIYKVTLPAQRTLNPNILAGERGDIEPASATFYAAFKTGSRALLNAFALLEVLYARNVSDPKVLGLALEATGHRLTQPRPASTSQQSATQGQKTYEE